MDSNNNKVVRCSSCGQRLYRYNEKTSMPFGSKVGVCPGCGKQYFNEMNIEPAALDKRQARIYALEYAWGNNFYFAAVPFALIIWLIMKKTDFSAFDDAIFVLQTLILFAVCYICCAALKILRYKKRIYPESELRMADPDYAELLARTGGGREINEGAFDIDLESISAACGVAEAAEAVQGIEEDEQT